MLDPEAREMLLSNYDENPVRAQRELESQLVNSNFIDCFADLGRGIDFRSTGRVWASLMVKLGYSGAINQPNAEHFPDVFHLIVWDPNIIQITQEESYRFLIS